MIFFVTEMSYIARDSQCSNLDGQAIEKLSNESMILIMIETVNRINIAVTVRRVLLIHAPIFFFFQMKNTTGFVLNIEPVTYLAESSTCILEKK